MEGKQRFYEKRDTKEVERINIEMNEIKKLVNHSYKWKEIRNKSNA